MDDKKIRVLGIAPYEGMKSIMAKLAKERTDMILDVYVGDLDRGAEIAQRNFDSNYDVIISRGGTAEMIGKITAIPVIEITLSVYDILRAIKLAENYSERYAIVGFPSITGSAHLLCDLLQYQIDIFTIHDEKEVQDTLKDLKKKGYRMVLCDMIANTTAKRIGLNAILITSGTESIQSAFDQAVKLSTSFSVLKEETRFLSNILQSQDTHTIVLDSNAQVYYSTLTAGNHDQILAAIKKELTASFSIPEHKFFKNIEGSLYSVTSHQLTSHGRIYIAFYFSCSQIPMAGSKYGLKYSNRQDIEERFFNNYYGVTGSDGMQELITQMTQCDFPVMITGEYGTGKEQVVGGIYAQSKLSHNPLITVNCSLLNDKTWNFLTNHYNSPFNDNNNTICINNIGALSPDRQKQLLSMMIDMNLCKRNRVIFSCVSLPDQPIPPIGTEIVNLLACLTLHLIPLRERMDEMPAFTSLYLNALNVQLAKQVIGFAPEALKMIQQYNWPQNYTQFKRILGELAVITSTPYISAEDVAAALRKERFHIRPDSSETTAQTSLDINRPLEEITRDIIEQTLTATRGNQSAAAKRLGISRTTLWRYQK